MGRGKGEKVVFWISKTVHGTGNITVMRGAGSISDQKATQRDMAEVEPRKRDMEYTRRKQGHPTKKEEGIPPPPPSTS